MRGVVAAAIWLSLVVGVGCLPGSQALPPIQARAARLVLGVAEPDRQGTRLTAVDPGTLADAAGLDPLELPRCSSGLDAQPAGELAAAVTGAATWPDGCGDADSAALRVLDLRTWSWRPAISLPSTDGGPLRLDGAGRWPIAWSADGASVYALTSSASEQRRLWLLDPSGSAPPTSVPLDFVPARLDVAPNGSSLFILGGQTAGGSRQGAVVSGSAFVAIYDPKTLVERVRVSLSGLSLGLPGQLTGSLTPGVAVAPDGSRYFVVHADRPLLDVVDTRAPGLERLERSVSLRDAPSAVGTRQAWLGVSRDAARLFVWHRAETQADDLGLQVVDTRTWQVQTLDTVAQRIGTSLDGLWVFELDPPAWSRAGAAPPQAGAPRDPTGSRLSVLDAATRSEVAVLVRDQFPFTVGQYGADRVYVSQFVRRQPGQAAAATLTAYDTSSWRELARRSLDGPGALVTLSPLW